MTVRIAGFLAAAHRVRVREILRSLGALVVAIGMAATGRGDAPLASKSCGTGCLQWEISSPPTSLNDFVTKQYPEITFDAGDLVKVDAGGCAHKRKEESGTPTFQYLNPSGYVGRDSPGAIIYVPGVTAGFVPLNYLVGQEWAVPESIVLSQRSLWLGFAPGQDRSPQVHKCLPADTRAGDPHVTVLIRKGGSATKQSSGPFPLDLVWSRTDVNGLPLNPRWSGQGPLPNGSWTPCQYGNCTPGITRERVLNGGKCTRHTPYWDLADRAQDTAFECLPKSSKFRLAEPGHVNWAPVAFEGQIAFAGFDSNDRDYNFELTPDRGEGLFPDQSTLHVEFNRNDVHALDVDFWRTLDNLAVDLGNDSEAAKHVGSKRATVIGLLGLDCRHRDRHNQCKLEIHPVYGMAIELARDSQPYGMISKWAVMVRNWGGEGECSRHLHLLYTDRLGFRLRGFPGAGAPVFDRAARPQQSDAFDKSFSHERKFLYSTPGGAVVVYELASPERRGGRRYVQDELVIRWDGSSIPRFASGGVAPPFLRTTSDEWGHTRAYCDDPRRAWAHPDRCRHPHKP